MQEIANELQDQSKPSGKPLSPEMRTYLERVFTYHAPKGDQPIRYELLRDNAKDLAILIAQMCPESRERSLAFAKLQECVMFANASIAINE